MKYLLLLVSLLLTACSNLPKAITDPPPFDLTYQQAVSTPNQYKNMAIRWGGTIVEVENEKTYSALQIMAYPLTNHGYPDNEQASFGRFVVKSSQFLDPAIYVKNSFITVAGLFEGMTQRTIGNKILDIPLIAAQHIHQWQEARNYGRWGMGYGFGYGMGYGGYPYGGFYGYGPYYPGGFYGFGPYFRGGYYRPFYPY